MSSAHRVLTVRRLPLFPAICSLSPGTCLLIGVAGGIFPSTVQADGTAPIDADWIMNSTGKTSILVVREPEGPPPGLDLPPDAPKPPPPPEMTTEVLGEPVPVNVLEVEVEGEYTRVRTAYVPDYKVAFTEKLKAMLESRPKFATDFPDGIKVKVGDIVEFGQDIGYSGDTCADGAGLGFWPPATFCATGIAVDNYLPNKPEPATEVCYTTLADVGIFMNGTVMFNWSDGQSYEGKGDWHNLAHVYETYDFDMCHGHSVQGMYHHHGYSSCLSDAVGDEGDGHSPIWGYAADGYAVHGPWQDEGVLAQSCWRVRDFDSREEGCGDDTSRSCVMNDPLNPASGTHEVSAGPRLGAMGQSMFSQNDITLSAGSFLEDFVYDPSCQAGPASLDQANGHEHDEHGYHYHISVDQQMKPAFPYSFGPAYAGKLHENALTSCGSGVMEFPTASNDIPSDVVIDLGEKRWARVMLDSSMPTSSLEAD